MAGEKTELEKLKQTVAVWLVAVAVGSSSVGGLGLWRSDSFGYSDADQMTAELRSQIMREMKLIIREHKLESDRVHFEIESNKPPPATRTRIQALESCLRRQCTDFTVPTSEW